MKKLIKVGLIILLILPAFTAYAEGTGNNDANNIVDLDKKTFLEKVFNYEKNAESWAYEGATPCIINFYADYCGPCRRLYPTLVDIAKEYNSKIIVYRINTEVEKELAAAFGIQGIPFLIFVPVNGKPQAATGALPKENLEEIINSFLLK